MVEERAPRFLDLWWAIVVAGTRSKFGLSAIVLMLAAAAWLFVKGEPKAAFFVLAVAVLTFARIPAALGVLIGLGLRKRKQDA
jgi:hypothetical protein